MPTASVRTGRSGTRVSGGPLFWLLAGMFIVAGYVMAWTFKAIVYLVAMIVREVGAARARRKARLNPASAARPAAPAVARGSVDGEPQDAVPHQW